MESSQKAASSKRGATNEAPKPFKLTVDSKLIRSNSSLLPDELRSLGIRAYDERDFEKGVLNQVDEQIAEFQLNARPHPDETSQDSEKSTKRKSSENEDFYRKKSKLLNLIQNEDQESTQSESPAERLIKTGEMTPFGTVVDFDNINVNSKTTKTTSTDFDSFLMGLDKRSRKPKPKPVIQPKEIKPSTSKQAEANYKSTDSTDFDLFLNNFDSKAKTSKPVETAKKVTTGGKTPNKSVQKVSDSSEVTEFDKFLLGCDAPKPKPKEKVKEKVKTTQLNTSTIDPLSFMRIIEEDDERSNSKSNEEESATTPKESNLKEGERFDLDSFLDSAPNDEQEDYDDVSNDKTYVPDEKELEEDDENVEYETDDDTNVLDEYDLVKKRRKKKFNKNCLDDGDETLYAKRMKRLEKCEKQAVKEEEEGKNEEDEELEDLEKELVDENLNDKEEENDSDVELLDEKSKDIVLNNNRHVELDHGFRVPENIWNRLYKFQKTALKWFWELHVKRCGGILGGKLEEKEMN